MERLRRRTLLAGVLAACASGDTNFLQGLAPGAARAQDYPTRPLRLVCGGAPGSVPDTVARLLGEQLAPLFGKPVVIDNRPGAGGIIAMQALMAAEPDGHTIALATMSQAVFNSYLFPKLPYAPQRDLAPVSPLVTGAMALAVHPGVAARTLPEFIALARAEPGRLFVSTAGTGSPPHVMAHLLARAAGIDVVFVPHKSGQEGMAAALRGDAQAFFDAPTILSGHARSGSLRALVVTGSEREPELPEVPTVAEAGLPQARAEAWIGVVAPAGTPAAVIARLNRQIGSALAGEAMRQRLRTISFVPNPGTPEEFRATIERDHAQWSRIIREAGIRIE